MFQSNGPFGRRSWKLEQLEGREVPSAPLGNQPPIPFFNTYTTDEDVAVVGNTAGSDADGDVLSFIVVDPPDHGSLVFLADGQTFTYTPDANYNNSTSGIKDFFTFKANDGTVDSEDVASISFIVNAVNDVPTVAPATFSIAENSPNGTAVGVVLGADVENDPLTYSIVGGNTNNAFAINPMGVLTVNNSAALDFETTPTFALTVQVSDIFGASVTAPIAVQLTDVQESVRVGIDIRPGDSQNKINLKSQGKIEVAILSTSTFDARDVDVNSLRFGRTGTEDSLSRNCHGKARYEYRDVNCDGRLDLVARFETQLTGFRAGDTLGKLTGNLLNGLSLFGDDTVKIKV